MTNHRAHSGLEALIKEGDRDAMKAQGRSPCLGDRREEKGFVTVWWVTDLLPDVGAFVLSVK